MKDSVHFMCLQLAHDEMVRHEADNSPHLEMLAEHISTLQLENSRLKGRVEVIHACIIYCFDKVIVMHGLFVARMLVYIFVSKRKSC